MTVASPVAIPGAPNKTNIGYVWPVSAHAGLKLPSGKTVGETDNESLRRELARLGVAEAHTAPRNVITARYADLIQKVHDDAGKFAVEQWLAQNRG